MSGCHLKEFRMKLLRSSLILLVLSVIVVLINAGSAPATGSDTVGFWTDGHALVFGKTGLRVAGEAHVLKIEFSGTPGVMPESAAGTVGGVSAVTGRMASGEPPLFRKVRYPLLWDGITLVYTCADDVIWESIYRLEPHANTENIRLTYNVPVKVTDNGKLLLQFKTGYMTESAPVAWQEVDGRKVSVPVSFRKTTAYEVGFETGAYNPALPLFIDPLLDWHTFVGSTDYDSGGGIAIDGSGNVYVTGTSSATWGATVRRSYTGGADAFVAKMDADGALQWNSFLGSASDDSGAGIAVDGSGNVYVTGTSSATWGTTVRRSYTGGTDAFVAKLNADGALQWNSLLGSASEDSGAGIAVDGSGNVYVTGTSSGSWGATVRRGYTGGADAFVSQLNADGELQWDTFLGSASEDSGAGIVVDGSGMVYITGTSSAAWGDTASYAGAQDAFVVQLDTDGVLQWNRFRGSADGNDDGAGIVVDDTGLVYITGASSETWGDTAHGNIPLNPYSGGSSDVLLATVSENGRDNWHTFMGSSNADTGRGIILGSDGNLYMTGMTGGEDWPWPSLETYAAGQDAFAMRLSAGGNWQWLSFMGSSADDQGAGIVVDAAGLAYVAGVSGSNWGAVPVNSYAGADDAFVARLSSTILPIVVTGGSSSIGSNAATVSGDVTDQGDTYVTAKGHCWSKSADPTLDDNHVLADAGVGAFSSRIPALAPDTKYHYRAYATNGAGTAYGEDATFKTLEEGEDHPLGREGHNTCFIESLLFNERDRQP